MVPGFSFWKVSGIFLAPPDGDVQQRVRVPCRCSYSGLKTSRDTDVFPSETRKKN